MKLTSGIGLLVAAFLRLALVLVAPTSTDAYRYSWEGRVANAGLSHTASRPLHELAFLRKTRTRDQQSEIDDRILRWP